MKDDEMRAMLIEFMGKGFLENIVALFKQEPELARFIPDMIGQENIGVRLGTTALVEEMATGYREILGHAVPGLLEMLHEANPTLRGDAAYLLGLIKGPSVREALTRSLQDPNTAVREIATEALKELG